jgi:hypothetical protein
VSLASEFETALKAELVKLEPNALNLSELAVAAVTKSVVIALVAVTPGPLKPLASLLFGGGAAELEKLADEELAKLFPAAPTVFPLGKSSVALTVAKVWPKDLPQGPEETVGDWPSERNK